MTNEIIILWLAITLLLYAIFFAYFLMALTKKSLLSIINEKSYFTERLEERVERSIEDLKKENTRLQNQINKLNNKY